MSDSIPHAVLSEQLQEGLQGRRVIAAIFLTFEFDPGFFEQQVLPVLLDIPLSHARGIKLVQLEDAIRRIAGRVSVYYDVNHLVLGDDGSARLDVRRIPVRQNTGVFHPKNIFLLVESVGSDEDGVHAQSLIVGAMSANLTRSGWWENLEACHLEELQEGEPNRMKEALADMLRKLREKTGATGSHEALELILKFLRKTEQRVKRAFNQQLLPHFYSKTESFPDFLEKCSRGSLRNSNLEIISPYLDEGKNLRPLDELLRRFQPKEVRILLPRDRDGSVCCSPELFEYVRNLENVSWGKLPQTMVRRGKSQDAASRFIHAKVYRFFTKNPKREFCFVGSVNLTTPAHQSGGNWESGMLVELECPRMPQFWLEVETAQSSTCNKPNEDDSFETGGTPLVLRYSWDLQTAAAYWDSPAASPQLQLQARGVTMGEVGPLKSREWTVLNKELANELALLLKETSFVHVIGYGDRPGLLLVQEEGMSHKPSLLLLELTVAEILRYWSMLTAAQRCAFIEANTLELGSSQDGAELLARVKMNHEEQTFFDRFAGFFHAFSCLEREVREQLEATRPVEADYRLFGRKYDSLGTLLERLFAADAVADDVERYVVLLCARQLLNDLGRDFTDYFRSRKADVVKLDEILAQKDNIRAQLVAANDTSMVAFLDWFEPNFLRRVKPLEEIP